MLTSVVFAGMLVGALFFSTLSDLIGRRSAFLGTVLLTALFGGLSAAAPSFAVLLLCRAVVGAGLAGVPAAYTLALEFLPSASRGRWMSWLQGFW